VSTVFAGQGLHSGTRASLRFERHEGPVVVRVEGREVPLAELRVVDTTRSTTIAAARGGARLQTVEHVFAALAGLGLHAGVALVLEGSEVPLADGGARAFVDALGLLGVAPTPPPLRVVRDGVLVVGASTYELFVAGAGEGGVDVEVVVDFDDARLANEAAWRGGADDFRERIAVARTFGFEREVAELLARGLASHVTPESVVVIGVDRVLSAGAPFSADEPARHKLLDLVGDLYLYGGPPRGRVRAIRPGHGATHEAMRRALAEGLVVREPP
jgi:UDP-3-O-[3-hydroxymyristoyl] N-acetylglucosamine deacetylase